MKAGERASRKRALRERASQERKIDEALKDTFPASDTPSFVGAGAQPEKSSGADPKPDTEKQSSEGTGAGRDTKSAG